jgi:hypothetical protein
VILCLDSGKRAVGCSLWIPETKTLYAAELVEGCTEKLFRDGPEVWRRTAGAVIRWLTHHNCRGCLTEVVFERPGAYGADRPYRTLDLQELIAVAAWVCALCPDAKHVQVFPREWKGNVPADVCCARARGRLFENELKVVKLPTAKSRHHNVWDSVGLGLWRVGRFTPTKIIAR